MQNETAQEKIQHALLEREVDEELAQERLQELWRRYKNWVAVVVIGTLTAVAGYNILQAQQAKIRRHESDIFEQAVIAHVQNNFGEAHQKFDSLIKGKTAYRYLAMMRSALLMMQEHKREIALNMLRQIIDDANAPAPVQDLTRLIYVNQETATGEIPVLQNILQPLLNAESPFYAQASELAAVLALRQNDLSKAKSYLYTATQSPAVGDDEKARLNEMIKLLGNADEK